MNRNDHRKLQDNPPTQKKPRQPHVSILKKKTGEMSVLPQFHGFFVGGNEFAFREGFKRQKDHDFEGDVSGGTVANTLGTPTESRIRASAT